MRTDHTKQYDEAELCEKLAPLIETYGLDTVKRAVQAIEDAGTWSGSPDPADPDNYWIDDETGERKPA